MTDEQREQLLEDRDKLTDALEQIHAVLLGDIQEFDPADEKLDVESCVKTYLLLREARERGKDRQDNRDRELRAHQSRIENALAAFLQRNTTTGLNTKYGTVFTSQQNTARVADKEAYLSYLLENGAWHLATIAANKAEVAKHLEEHDGELPPGIDYSTRIAVQIRRK